MLQLYKDLFLLTTSLMSENLNKNKDMWQNYVKASLKSLNKNQEM